MGRLGRARGSCVVLSDSGTPGARHGYGLPITESAVNLICMSGKAAGGLPGFAAAWTQDCCACAGALAELQAVVAGLAHGAGVGLPIMEAAAEAEAHLAALAQRCTT